MAKISKSLYNLYMNLIVWIISGGLLGSTIAWFFASSPGTLIGYFLSAIIGSVFFGFVSSKFMPETPPLDLDYQSFSPGALLFAIFGAIIFMTLYLVFINCTNLQL
ncbi:MAG TPA: hypothetical protein VF974_07965 [Patescibacteria group bacterium]